MDNISQFFSALPDVLISFMKEILSFLVSCVDAFMVPICEAIPDLELPFQQFYKFLGLVDQFIAINYAVVLFSTWVTFSLSVSLVNWCLGLIPGEN